MEPHRGATPTHETGGWRQAFEDTDVFTRLRKRSFPNEQHLTPALVVDRVLSVSFIVALPEAEREAVAGEVRALLESDQATKGRSEIAFPYRTDVYTWARR